MTTKKGSPANKKFSHIESLIAGLQPGEAIHLGHSAVIVNLAGVRVGLDIASTNGSVASPFANLTLESAATLKHLLPMHDVQSMLPQAEFLGKHLDVLLYSHLHSDHFSLAFIQAARKGNPRLRVVCPPNTRRYLSDSADDKTDGIFMRFLKKPVVDYVLRTYDEALHAFRAEMQNPSSIRQTLISSLEELPPGQTLEFGKGKSVVELSSFFVCHPAYQAYVRLPIESAHVPAAVGYKIAFSAQGAERKAILVGETATEPAVFSLVFKERDGLALLCFPVTEQAQPGGTKFLEELVAHSGLRSLALLERLVADDTRIIPLHQGLWYFQLSDDDIVRGRDALSELGGIQRASLPFVLLTRILQSIPSHLDAPQGRLGEIVGTAWGRWRNFKRIARAVAGMPVRGEVITNSVGRVVDFTAGSAQVSTSGLSTEAVIQALNAHFKEYDVLFNEILNAWTWQKDLVYYSLLAIGFAITMINVFPDIRLLYIGTSIALSALGFSFLEQTIRMGLMGRFFSSQLFPRINALIRELDKRNVQSPAASKLKVLLWEKYFRSGDVGTGLMGLAAAGKFSVTILPSIVFVILFYLSKMESGLDWSMFEKMVFGFAAVISLFPVVIFIWNIRYAFKGK